MAFNSITKMLSNCDDKSLVQYIIEKEASDYGISNDDAINRMKKLYEVMKTSSQCYSRNEKSISGLTGGEGGLYDDAIKKGGLLGGDYFNEVIKEALKVAECNACMKRIVASPTAGSCGVLPAVLIPYDAEEEKKIESLFVAAAFGEVAANRATISGAEGGCQAEVGVASAMAAAALTYLQGGNNSQIEHAFSIAMTNLLGLVCDPIAGLVEIPCVKRNVIGAVNAISSSNMAMAGLKSIVPADEVIDALMMVAKSLPTSLRETGEGGLAATPTGIRITKELTNANKNHG